MSLKRTILIADDHGIMREGLASLLKSEPDLEVIGMVCNGHEAMTAAERLHPDLIILDISMPLTDGPEAIAHIKRRQPKVRVLILTFHMDENHVRAALQSGADGYALKDDSRAELMTAIRAVAGGKSYLSPAICDRVVSGYLGNHSGNGQSVPTQGIESLTGREREVLKLVAEGHRTRQIAEFLSLSTKTVEKHRSNLMRKLGAQNAASLAAYAINNGFTRPY